MGQPSPVKPLHLDQLFQQARKAVEAKEWPQALRCFQEILRRLQGRKKVKAERWLNALLGYARCLLALGRAPDAQQVVRRALRLDPSHAEAKELYVSALLALGQWRTALRYARRWLSRQPKEWRVHLQLARIYNYRNQMELCHLYLISALHLGIDAPQVFQGVADMLEQQGRLSAAIAIMRRAVRRFPQNSSLWVTLGLLLQKDRRLRRALQCFQRAIELGGDSPTVRMALGFICSELGRLDQAIAHLQKGLQQDPQNLGLLDLLSFAYLQQGRLRDALVPLSRMAALAPTDPMTHFKLASVHYQMGNYREAVNAYRRVIALAPGTEVAREAQEILDMIDHVQLEQVFVLSMEDPVFRASLIQDPKRALEAKGFALSESSLEVVANTDFSRLPKRWRSSSSGHVS